MFKPIKFVLAQFRFARAGRIPQQLSDGSSWKRFIKMCKELLFRNYNIFVWRYLVNIVWRYLEHPLYGGIPHLIFDTLWITNGRNNTFKLGWRRCRSKCRSTFLVIGFRFLVFVSEKGKIRRKLEDIFLTAGVRKN